ncbi:MAG: ribosome biogenesis GTPase YlqF [Myxococcales bacterium]|nr:ribosome biogenesis GTPase YlqF [Myxococcales bacterium]
MRINWFPGHMNKARREMRGAMRRTDVVVEVLDARLPRSSQNPMLERLAGRVPVVRVLAKSDLADPRATARWLERFESQGKPALAIVGSRKSDAARVLGACRKLALPRRKVGRPTYAMVVGIPNVGKSTLMNSLAGRKVAAVEDRPAVTQRQQQTEASDDVLIMDTPGVLWPRLEDQEGATRLALSGAIREAVIDVEAVARYGLGLLAERYPEELRARYELSLDQAKVEGSGARETESGTRPGVSDADQGDGSLDLLGAFDVVGAFERQRGIDTFALLEQLGKRRGCLLKGGEVDREKAARVFLADLRQGRLGSVSLDWPDETRLRLPKPPERVVRGRVAAWGSEASDGVSPREIKPRGKKLGKHSAGRPEARSGRAASGEGGRRSANSDRGRASPTNKLAKKPRAKPSTLVPDAKNRPAKSKAKPRLSLKKRSGGR